MPKNKNAFIRYRLIDSCLRRRKGYFPTKNDLIEACAGLGSVSARTIDKDIFDMKNDEELGYFAPIEYNKQQKGYYYSDPNYSINKIPLKQEDLYAMEFACSILKQFEGIDAVKQFMDSVSKIEDFISMQRTWSSNDWNKLIQAERALSNKGNEFLSPLLLHIKEQTKVILHYQRFGEHNYSIHTFHPYVLKEYRNRWYTTGWSESKSSILTFALERIKEIVPTHETFEPNPTFDAEHYFKYSFGISVVNAYKPEVVRLQFAASEIPFVKSLPLHQTQQIESEDEQSMVIRMEVIPSYELKAEIFRFGDKVKVLAPETLVAEHKKVLEQARKQYDM